VLEREKGTIYRTGQDRKKVTKGLYFTYLGRSPIEAIYIKNCALGKVLDVSLIMCTKFQNEIFMAYDFKIPSV